MKRPLWQFGIRYGGIMVILWLVEKYVLQFKLDSLIDVCVAVILFVALFPWEASIGGLTWPVAKVHRLLVIGIGVLGAFLFLGMTFTNWEFFAENDVSHWDGKLVMYLALVGLGSLLTVASLIFNRYFSRHLWLSWLVVGLFLGAKVMPLHLNDYRQLLYPDSYQEMTRLAKLTNKDDDGEIVYVYQSSGARDHCFQSTFNRYLKQSGNSFASFDLANVKKRLSVSQYATFKRQIGVTTTPALMTVTFNRRAAYVMTLNAIDQPTNFNRMRHYVNDASDVKRDRNVVVVQK